MQNTARLIQFNQHEKGSVGIYQLNPPIEDYELIGVFYTQIDGVKNLVIFPVREDSTLIEHVIDSCQGTSNHQSILARINYYIV